MTPLLSKVNRGVEFRNEMRNLRAVRSILFDGFNFKMSHNIYHMSSRATIQEYQPLRDTKVLAAER